MDRGERPAATGGPRSSFKMRLYLSSHAQIFPDVMSKPTETPRRVVKKDASNFDDYLVVGLILSVIIGLVAALILL